ncbi:UvrD-helicase domain-containing protein [Gordonia alkaliphila]|uniref:UvrD-helicase domain-containing protein n=1 Tax=Gordonia alkaliphila TaxID=1053547 RepID=UPI001FF6D56A|nr:UvrD-helicase domain-containing protein [Gordonia alkaliphila]MCK0440753.1 UvrD-helicase domain-containing protein [Gordonia alkaliphila]
MTPDCDTPDCDTPDCDTTDFDACAPLPTGTMILEASAGTGKTHAIVSLAVRYLAEGVAVDQLLMATFSNAASNELRDRTRTRIGQALAALADPAAYLAADRPDEVLALLCTGPDEQVRLRRQRLRAAMSDFDAATVATTHTFCNRMLATLGFLGERAQQFPIVENVQDLVDELARDLYLAQFAGNPSAAPAWAAVADIARSAVEQSATALSPDPDGDETTALRVDLARTTRTEIEARKRLARIRTYDDLQDVLFRILQHPEVGALAVARIRQQFSVVLIDEFQDTDPQQWAIVRQCFHDAPDIPLILVGDPKQSIYAFRGAEVLSYLDAVGQAGLRRRLSVNWRSDQPLVQSLERIFEGTAFGHPQITFAPVRARRERSRLGRADDPATGGTVDPVAEFEGRDYTAPLRMRMLLTQQFGGEGLPTVGKVRDAVTEDVADDIVALLESGTTIAVGDPAVPRPVEPGDIAILVNFNKRVEPLQEALHKRGISSVVRSGTSIFKTPAARHWWYVLAAIEQPSRTARVRLAALTPLIGQAAADVDTGGDDGIGTLASSLAELGRIFAESGFASMSARLFDTFGTEGRLLAGEGGERTLTDLRQLADLCNRQVAGGSGGLASLVAWLAEQIADPSNLRHGGAQTRRLDRDTRAVQIMTVHASKGLEFPIVYVPFGWDGARVPDLETFIYHDAQGRRRLDVGGTAAAGYREREHGAIVEGAGEALRLLYVAMTRASSQVVAWWGPSMPTKQGALHRLLFTAPARRSALQSGQASTLIPVSVEIPPTDREMHTDLLAVREGAPELIAVEPAGRLPRGRRWHPAIDGGARPDLTVASFTAPVDLLWRRTSYSGIVRDAHAAAHAALPPAPVNEPERALLDDEPDLDEQQAAAAAATGGMPSLMNGLPFGAGFGTLVHEVLEHVDTSAPDLAAHVRLRTAEGALLRGVDLDVDQLARALYAVLTTPLGFGAGGFGDEDAADLASIAPRDRLAELDFELPLAAPGFTLAEIGELMALHLPDDDPLRPYAEIVPTVSGERFRGFLTGSIDSVLRLRDGRFAVVDYKTNRLRPGELMVEDFDTAAMAEEMMAAHYPLQALLYSVALHRYLRWRLPDYAPGTHLGPIQYQFVRGMAGPDTPPGCGVFEWRLPPALVADLSDLLAGVAGMNEGERR